MGSREVKYLLDTGVWLRAVVVFSTPKGCKDI